MMLMKAMEARKKAEVSINLWKFEIFCGFILQSL